MLCDYGCGTEGMFTTSSGRYCCCEKYNSCIAVRKRNADGVSKAWGNGTKSMPDDFVPHNKGKSRPELFKADFSLNGKGNHKGVLIFERGHKCESCQNTEWLDEPITLELEHIDGNNKNNVKENLQLLCPNCHSKTSTWRRRKSTGGRQKYTDIEYINAIQTSSNLNQVLEKLDLRYGSVSTISNIIIKYKINFMGC